MTAPVFLGERISQVTPESVGWLWEFYLLRGRLVFLNGDPGVGKSMLALDLAARLSRGGTLPDGKPVARPHTTLFLSAEDRVHDTLRPRAEAAGADLERMIHVRSSTDTLMRLPADLPALEALIRDHHADLVVIDPLSAFLPVEVASGSDASVRGVLGRLDALTEQTGCTLLLIRHLRKRGGSRAIYRSLGSIGFSAAVRSDLLAARNPRDPGQSVLAVTKTNIAGPARSMSFRVRSDEQGRGAIEWLGPVELAADDLELTLTLRPRDRAAAWLVDYLSKGPRSASDVLAAAAREGIPDRTLDRAKTFAGVKSHQVALKTGERIWYLYYPAAPWPVDAPFKRPSYSTGFDPFDTGFDPLA